MNYAVYGRQIGKTIVEEQMININILYAILGRKVAFASPNKEKIKNKVLKILDENNIDYIFKENKVLFKNNGKIEFV